MLAQDPLQIVTKPSRHYDFFLIAYIPLSGAPLPGWGESTHIYSLTCVTMPGWKKIGVCGSVLFVFTKEVGEHGVKSAFFRFPCGLLQFPMKSTKVRNSLRGAGDGRGFPGPSIFISSRSPASFLSNVNFSTYSISGSPDLLIF